MTRTRLFGREVRAGDVKGIRMMDVAKMVSEALSELEEDRLEIRSGLSNVLNWMSRVAPRLILNRLSRTAERMYCSAGTLTCTMEALESASIVWCAAQWL